MRRGFKFIKGLIRSVIFLAVLALASFGFFKIFPEEANSTLESIKAVASQSCTGIRDLFDTALSDDDDDTSTADDSEEYFSLADVDEWDGETQSVIVNDGEPFFTSDELSAAAESYLSFSDTDLLGRCGAAMASITVSDRGEGDRGSLSGFTPSGWQQATYDFIEDGSLYNRSHLIGWQFWGEDTDDTRNLITGTYTFNHGEDTGGMLMYESMIADYTFDNPDVHILYRVTPYFDGVELVARGVLMEAESVEDGGEFKLCVFVYIAEPGVTINYSTGYSSADLEEENSMTAVIAFIVGFLAGALLAVMATCLCIAAGRTNREEEMIFEEEEYAARDSEKQQKN